MLSVKINYGGAYIEMNRVSDNYFTAFANGGQAFNLPTTLQITSVLGDTVFDTLSTNLPQVSPQPSSNQAEPLARVGACKTCLPHT